MYYLILIKNVFTGKVYNSYHTVKSEMISTLINKYKFKPWIRVVVIPK